MIILLVFAVLSWGLLVHKNSRSSIITEPLSLEATPSDSNTSEQVELKEQNVSTVSVPPVLDDSLIDRHVVVNAIEYSYKVGGTILAKPGENLRILFENIGKLPHDLTVKKLGITTGTIQPGDSISIDIQIPQDAVSNYEFYSTVGKDKELGMEGRIIMQEDK